MRRVKEVIRTKGKRKVKALEITHAVETKGKKLKPGKHSAKIVGIKAVATHNKDGSVAYSKVKAITIPNVDPAKDKRLAKEIREAVSSKRDKKAKPFQVILEPTVIIPLSGAPVIADAGSIVMRMVEQNRFYRDAISPVTNRADELLVYFGNAKKPQLGWVKAKPNWKAVVGPTFLVQTRDDSALSGWDRMRYLVAKDRKSGWLGDWLAVNASEERKLIRSVIKEFGGKVTLHEPDETRIALIGRLVLNQELTMVAKGKKVAKKSAKRSAKELKLDKELERQANAKEAKEAKKLKKAKGKKAADKKEKPKKGKSPSGRIPRADLDGMVIKRLVSESPFRAGTYKASQWKLLKKGMTVGELVEKGGARGDVNWYVRRGWCKLLRPKTNVESDE